MRPEVEPMLTEDRSAYTTLQAADHADKSKPAILQPSRLKELKHELAEVAARASQQTSEFPGAPFPAKVPRPGSFRNIFQSWLIP